MKTLAYIPLHYGKEYLNAVIKSIDDHVDQILILYTAKPSYGQDRLQHNPDSKDELYQIAHDSSSKIKWVDIPIIIQEHKHRNIVFNHSAGFDLIMAVDADEIWDDVDVAKKAAYDSKLQNVNVGGDCWWHFWRSFNECHRDGFYPTRFHCVNGNPGSTIMHVGKIYHMGYAQSEAITKYKISCHGHKGILDTWLKEKWIDYIKGETKYLHPDSQTVWIETQPFDKTTLPQVLKEHPYYNLDKIV